MYHTFLWLIMTIMAKRKRSVNLCDHCYYCSCQFVVKYSGDYSVHLADPDLLVEWDLIEQVVSSVGTIA